MIETPRKAVRDDGLTARITGRVPLVYREGPSESDDRPPFVRAASGLGTFREYLIAVQDDANWIALIDGDHQVRSLPLPRGPHGARLFDDKHGNAEDKIDLEACVVMAAADGFEIIAFGSGTASGREWVLRASCADPACASADDLRFEARFCPAADFYATLRDHLAFSGGNVNIEGAVALDHDCILLMQRGNASAEDGEAVDATAELSWTELRANLDRGGPPPKLREVTRYDLGELKGVRLTFSDAEKMADGRILYSASAEDPHSDRICGSVLGIIAADGSARWTEIADEDGAPFASKIEGLTVDPLDPLKVCFVIDDDDTEAPSALFLAELGGGFVSGA